VVKQSGNKIWPTTIEDKLRAIVLLHLRWCTRPENWGNSQFVYGFSFRDWDPSAGENSLTFELDDNIRDALQLEASDRYVAMLKRVNVGKKSNQAFNTAMRTLSGFIQQMSKGIEPRSFSFLTTKLGDAARKRMLSSKTEAELEAMWDVLEKVHVIIGLSANSN